MCEYDRSNGARAVEQLTVPVVTNDHDLVLDMARDHRHRVPNRRDLGIHLVDKVDVLGSRTGPVRLQPVRLAFKSTDPVWGDLAGRFTLSDEGIEQREGVDVRDREGRDGWHVTEFRPGGVRVRWCSWSGWVARILWDKELMNDM